MMFKEGDSIRIQLLLDAIVQVAEGNYNAQVPLSEKNDIIDGIALGLNIMMDEIKENIHNAESAKLRYRNLINTMQEGILEVDMTNRIKFVNESFCRMTGYSEQELIGKIAYEVLLDADSPDLIKKSAFQRKIGWPSTQRFELPIKRKNKTTIWLRFNSSSIVNSNGEIRGSLGTCHDITVSRRERMIKEVSYNIARKTTESNQTIEDLSQTIYYELRHVIDATNFYLGIVDDASGVLQFPLIIENKSLRRKSFARNRKLMEYVLTSGKTLFLNEDELADFTMNNKIQSHDKNRAVFLGIPLKLNEKTIGVLAVHSPENPQAYDDYDVGLLEFVSGQIAAVLEKQKAYDSIRKSEEMQHSLLNSTSAITMIIQDKKFVYVNRAMERLTGYTFEELRKIDPWSIIAEEDRSKMLKRGEDRLKGKIVIDEYESVLVGKNDNKLAFEISACVINYKGRKAILATCFNITKRKVAEKELKISELKYRSLINNMAEGLLQVDNDEIIEFVSDRFCQITGYKGEELIGKVARDILLKKDSEEYKAMLESLNQRKAGRTGSMELPIVCFNGKIKWMLNSGAPCYGANGDIIGSVGILTDISEIKEANVKLRTEKTAALNYQSQLLSAQLSPHFIFNALNSINYHILNQSAEEVINYVSEFSILMRKVLMNSANKRIRLEDEINFLRDYLNIETKRLPEKLSFSIKTDKQLDIDEIEIPPMLLQPFVENAIKHGIAHKQNSG